MHLKGCHAIKRVWCNYKGGLVPGTGPLVPFMGPPVPVMGPSAPLTGHPFPLRGAFFNCPMVGHTAIGPWDSSKSIGLGRTFLYIYIYIYVVEL